MEKIKDKAFGVIPVFKDKDGGLLFCLIRHAEGHWGLPKGHQNAGESDQQTALRELKEETSIDDVVLSDKFFMEEYTFKKDGIEYDKSVKYFIGTTLSTKSEIPENFKEEILELKWVTYDEAGSSPLFYYPRKVLDEVIKYL